MSTTPAPAPGAAAEGMSSAGSGPVVHLMGRNASTFHSLRASEVASLFSAGKLSAKTLVSFDGPDGPWVEFESLEAFRSKSERAAAGENAVSDADFSISTNVSRGGRTRASTSASASSGSSVAASVAGGAAPGPAATTQPLRIESMPVIGQAPIPVLASPSTHGWQGMLSRHTRRRSSLDEPGTMEALRQATTYGSSSGATTPTATAPVPPSAAKSSLNSNMTSPNGSTTRRSLTLQHRLKNLSHQLHDASEKMLSSFSVGSRKSLPVGAGLDLDLMPFTSSRAGPMTPKAGAAPDGGATSDLSQYGSTAISGSAPTSASLHPFASQANIVSPDKSSSLPQQTFFSLSENGSDVSRSRQESVSEVSPRFGVASTAEDAQSQPSGTRSQQPHVYSRNHRSSSEGWTSEKASAATTAALFQQRHLAASNQSSSVIEDDDEVSTRDGGGAPGSPSDAAGHARAATVSSPSSAAATSSRNLSSALQGEDVVLMNARILTNELRSALEHAEVLTLAAERAKARIRAESRRRLTIVEGEVDGAGQSGTSPAHASSSSGQSARENAALQEENRRLRRLLAKYTPIVEKFAPAEVEDVGNEPLPASKSSGHASQQQRATPAEQVAVMIPYETDSPMLRERMDRFEATLDGLRQSLKQCVKSGSAYLTALNTLVELGVTFSEDCARSPMPALREFGKFIAIDLEGRDKLNYALETDFIVPLNQFASDDLKQANHVRAEVDRRRETFEAIESKLMSHFRKGKEHRSSDRRSAMMKASAGGSSIISAMTSPSLEPSNALGGSLEDGADLRSSESKLLAEWRTAEVQFESTRCRLIHILNHVAIDQYLVTDRCASRATVAYSAYFSGMSRHTQALSTKFEQKALAQPTGPLTQTSLLNDAELETKRHELQACLTSPSLPMPFRRRRRDAEPDLVHEGWLFKRSSNVMKDWKKRFFQIKGGALLYFQGDTPTHVADIVMCMVRDAKGSHSTSLIDRGSFEVVSYKRTIVMQASSEQEKEAWVNAIRRTMERELIGGAHTKPLSSSEALRIRSEETPDVLDATANPAATLVDFAGSPNSVCAECLKSLGSTPDWVSLNLAVFICIDCSGHHRYLGTHHSKIRSLQLDKVTGCQVDVLKRLGNSAAKKVWEDAEEAVNEARQRVLSGQKDWRWFVHEKYVNAAFVKPVLFDQDALIHAVLTDDLAPIAGYFAKHRKSMPFEQVAVGPLKRSLLHLAVEKGFVASVELMILNGVQVDIPDATGKTPADLLQATSPPELAALLHNASRGRPSRAAATIATQDF